MQWKNHLFAIGFSFLILIVGYVFITTQSIPNRIVDEKVHVTQVQRIYKGDSELVKRMTTLPGYHYITAGVIHTIEPILGFEKVTSFHVRAVNIIYTIILFVTAVFLLTFLHQKKEKALLILALPILAPYFFLGYTEVLSAVVVLLSFFVFLKEKKCVSALLLLVAVLIRQDNIIWAGLFMALGTHQYLDMTKRDTYFKFAANVRKYLLENAPYISLMIVFIGFLFYNGGVAIGDADAHPASLDLNNVFFFLCLFGLLFLPTILSRVSEITKLVQKHMHSSMFVGALFIIGYLSAFHVKHSYNLNPFFLHNHFLQFLTENVPGTFLGIVLSLLAIGFLWFMAREDKQKKHFLPAICAFSALFLFLHPLTEHRYSVIPMILIILFMSFKSKAVFYLQLIYFLALTIILYWGALVIAAFKW